MNLSIVRNISYKDKWDFIKQNSQKIREDELLDKYLIEISKDDEQVLIKKAMKKIKECELRRWSFKYIISHIGKGLNSS